MKSGLTVILIIIGVFLSVAAIGWLVTMFNNLVQLRNNIAKAWHNIDVLLLQRNEEFPKLIDVMKASVRHEQELFHSLTALRTSYEMAPSTPAKANIENRIRERLAEMKLVAEQYPDLKSDELYRKTMERISMLETIIADRRVFFNETVNIYNTQMQQYPQAILANLIRYRPHPYLGIKQSQYESALLRRG